ncbi:hypothetical protein ACFL5T_02695 [Gemmatimonadota bacterium]
MTNWRALFLEQADELEPSFSELLLARPNEAFGPLVRFADKSLDNQRQLRAVILHRDFWLPEEPAVMRDELAPHCSLESLPSEVAVHASSYRSSLLKWGDKHHLYDAWVYQFATNSLLDASLGLNAHLPVTDLWSWSLRVAGPTIRSTYKLRGWNPSLVRRFDYRSDELKRFAEYLERQMDECELQYREWGWSNSPHKKEIAGGPAEHFRWLVFYQVKGFSYKRIKDEFRLASWQAAQKGIHRTAKIIGLTVRHTGANAS